MVSEPVVKIENVIYTHWNQETPTLKGVSLEIYPGTLNILIGPGGSGKSTLCSLFNGEIPHLLGGHMEGRVLVKGIDTQQSTVKDLAHISGHMLQDPETMFATLYVEDEIAFGPENLRLAPVEITATVDHLLDYTSLEPQRHNLVWNLSGGQIQKLGLAAILAMKPEILVLDEPTANLDPQATRSVHETVLDLRAQGITILLVTREVDEFILAQADQLLVMDGGQVVAAGPVQKVLAEYGETLSGRLGIWLPETVEISLGLHKRFGASLENIPFEVSGTLALLHQANLLHSLLERDCPAEPANPPDSGAALITARDLIYSYANGFQALKGVSFDIYPGEMLAIVGRNGAGKSTLAKLIVGLLKPQKGALTLFGKPAKQWKVENLAANIALVFQNPEHQFLTDTVHDEIAYSLLARGITDPQEVERMVAASLEQLALQQFAGTHPFALSAGMKRRLGVATMLVCRPQVLLVDEPTYGQDKAMTHTLMALMKDIRAQGVAVVMITHDMRLVQEFASRVMVMTEGQVVYSGDPTTLFNSDDMLRTANLRPTLLQELLEAYQKEGGKVNCTIHNSDDFLDALDYSLKAEATHGRQ